LARHLCLTGCRNSAPLWTTVLLSNSQRKCADKLLAHCRFHRPAISNANILIYIFSNKIYASNFVKQHSEAMLRFEITKMLIAVWGKNYCVIYCNFRHTVVPSMCVRMNSFNHWLPASFQDSMQLYSLFVILFLSRSFSLFVILFLSRSFKIIQLVVSAANEIYKLDRHSRSTFGTRLQLSLSSVICKIS